MPEGRKSSVSKRLRSPRCRPMKYSIGRAVLEVRDAAEGEHGRSFGDAEVVRDLGRRGPCLHRARAAVELEAELLLVRLEERAVAHVELQDRGAERMRHVRGRDDERLAAQEPQPLEEHDLLRLRQLEHRGDVRRDRLHLEPQHLRLQPLAAGAEVFVEARQRLRDELRHLRLGDERPFSLQPSDEPCSLEVAQRLADDGPAHVVALAERRLRRDLLARGEHAAGNRALEQLAQLVVERDWRGLVDRARDPGACPGSPRPSRSPGYCNYNMLALQHRPG